MRYTRLMLVLLVFASTLCAADAFVGTWKMNPAKTKYKVGTPPKELTVTITEAGSNLNVKVDGTAADRSKTSFSYSVPAAGGTGKMTSSAYDGVSAKRIGENEREMTYMKGGKSVYTAHSEISTDGNSLTVATKGLNPMGQAVEANVVYDKQK